MARTPHGDRGGRGGRRGRGDSTRDDQAGSSGDRRRPPRGLARGLLGNPPQAPIICRVGTHSILDATPRNTLLGIVRNRFSSPWMRWADVDDHTRQLIIDEFRRYYRFEDGQKAHGMTVLHRYLEMNWHKWVYDWKKKAQTKMADGQTLKDVRPDFISAAVWDQMCSIWEGEAFKKMSAQRSAARQQSRLPHL